MSAESNDPTADELKPSDPGLAGGIGPAANADSDDPAVIFRRLGPAGWLAVVAGTLPLLGAATLLATMNDIAPWLRSHAETGVAMFIVAFAILSGIAILPTHAAAILGGWSFGFSVGYPACLAGFLGGSLIGYLIARRASGARVVDLLNEKPKWKAVYDALLHGGFGKTLLIVTLVRLPPNSPFALTNLVLAATRVPVVTYLIGTLLGMMPRVAVVVWISSHASQLDFNAGKNIWLLVGGIVSALLVLGVLGVIAQRAIAHATGDRSANNER